MGGGGQCTVFLDSTSTTFSTKQPIKCLAQGHNTVNLAAGNLDLETLPTGAPEALSLIWLASGRHLGNN